MRTQNNEYALVVVVGVALFKAAQIIQALDSSGFTSPRDLTLEVKRRCYFYISPADKTYIVFNGEHPQSYRKGSTVVKWINKSIDYTSAIEFFDHDSVLDVLLALQPLKS